MRKEENNGDNGDSDLAATSTKEIGTVAKSNTYEDTGLCVFLKGANLSKAERKLTYIEPRGNRSQAQF